MNDGNTELSFGDLLGRLVHEFTVAIPLVKRNNPTVRLHSVKLSIGQKEAPSPSEHGSSLLLSERYSNLDDGWRLELELGEEGDHSRLDDLEHPVTRRYRSALDFFGMSSTTIIKGIDKGWQAKLAELGVSTVIQLVNMEDLSLKEIMERHRSVLPREFRGKARLLDTPLPPLSSERLKKLHVYDLAYVTGEELTQLIGIHHMSAAETVMLSPLIDTLFTAVDTGFLKKVNLGELCNQPR